MVKSITLTLVLGIFVLSANAFALEWANCSNADGSLKRVEEEVWGANPVTWLRNNEEVAGAKEKWNDEKKVVLDRKETQNKTTGRVVSVDEVYATEVTVSARIGGSPQLKELRVTDFVICKSHWDDRRD